MTYDQNTGTGYIRISSKLEAIADSWPLDGHVDGIGVVLDLDSQRRVLGIELLGMPGHGPKDMVAAVASGAIAEASATEGFELPALGSNPDIIVQPSHRTTLVDAN